jgi:hypothetical protein
MRKPIYRESIFVFTITVLFIAILTATITSDKLRDLLKYPGIVLLAINFGWIFIKRRSFHENDVLYSICTYVAFISGLIIASLLPPHNLVP